MKRILAIIAIMAASLIIAAESDYHAMKIGIAGGVSTSLAMKLDSFYGYTDQSLGFQLHVNSLISIRPSLILYRYERKYENKFSGYPEYTADQDLYLGLRLDMPFHFLRFSDASIYAGPSAIYLSAKQEEWSYSGGVYKSYEAENTFIGGGLLIGGQYNPSEHFGVYLDVGASYLLRQNHSRYFDNTGSTTSESRNAYTNIFFTGPTIGAILYLN